MSAGHLDNQWIRIDESEDVDFFVRFLDASRVRQHEFAKANPAAAFGHLEPKPGTSLLDCGCGTGDGLRLLQPLFAPGRLVGIDFSDKMLEEARSRGGDLEFHQADVQALPFESNSFQRVTATALLIHVPDPRKGLEEMVRVTEPGGLVAITDMDWDSLVIALDDVSLARSLSRAIVDGIRHPHIVWDAGGWLRELGVEEIRVLPQAVMLAPHEFVHHFLVEPSLRQLVRSGTFSEEQASTIRSQFQSRNSRGAEHAAATIYTIVGRKSAK